MAITDEDFVEATLRGAQSRGQGMAAISARYDASRGLIEVALDNRAFFSFPPDLAQELEGATPDQLSEIEVVGAGVGLYFPALDADLYVPGLVEGIFGSKAWMASRLGQEGGRARSERKSAAARENGKLGGRPRKAG